MAFARELEFSKVVFNFFVGLASVYTLTEIRDLSYKQFTAVNYSCRKIRCSSDHCKCSCPVTTPSITTFIVTILRVMHVIVTLT